MAAFKYYNYDEEAYEEYQKYSSEQYKKYVIDMTQNKKQLKKKVVITPPNISMDEIVKDVPAPKPEENWETMRPEFLWDRNRPKFFERLTKLIESGQKIPSVFMDFYYNYTREFNQNNLVCDYNTQQLGLKDKMFEFYSTWNYYLDKSPCYISNDRAEKWKSEGKVFFDEINGIWYDAAHEPKEFVLVAVNPDIENPDPTKQSEYFTEKQTSQRFCNSQVEAEKFKVTPITRNKKLYSTVSTNYVEHNQKRNFAQPARDSLVFGLELELLFPSYTNKIVFSAWLEKYYPNWVAMRDGSLEDAGQAGEGGLELVSPPLSLEQHRDETTKIVSFAKKLGGQGYVEGNTYYGMHVNINIPHSQKVSWQTVAKRLIVLVNNPYLRNFWQTAARRQGPVFDEYCPFRMVQFDTCLRTESQDHYRTAHYRPDTQCVEIRIFRSNLSYKIIDATLELMKICVMYCQQDNYDITVKSWHDFLYKNASENLIVILTQFKSIKALREALNSEEDRVIKSRKRPDEFFA